MISRCATHRVAVVLTAVSASFGVSTLGAAPAHAQGASHPVTGWVASTDHSVRARKAPTFSSAATRNIPAGARVSGTLNGDWIKTTYGYVNKGVLEFASPKPTRINARIPKSSLRRVPLTWNTPASFAPNYTASTTRYLNCTALGALTSLENAYRARFGHYAYIDLAYRDWNEQMYWYKKLGPRYANYPGTSAHGWGLAVDFREQDTPNEFAWGHSGYVWLSHNAWRFGFAGDPVPYGTAHESYHWNFAG